jgi:hypothetical protein
MSAVLLSEVPPVDLAWLCPPGRVETAAGLMPVVDCLG